jgi:hypothetical protein
MGKFTAVTKDVFSVFASPEWLAENIKTYPRDFVQGGLSSEFIRVSVLTPSEGVNTKSVNGVMLVEIFTEAGKGPNRANVIADALDKHFSKKTLKTGSGMTQLFDSVLTYNGLDADNSALVKSTFSIQFKYFEV